MWLREKPVQEKGHTSLVRPGFGLFYHSIYYLIPSIAADIGSICLVPSEQSLVAIILLPPTTARFIAISLAAQADRL